MRNRFRGWYPLDNDERDKLWNEGIVVLDTNVLLDLYRRSPASRKSLFASLESVAPRLWLPYQVGLEFHKMRVETRAGVAKTHATIADKVRNDTSALIKLIVTQRDYNPAIDDDQSLRDNLRDAAEKLSAEIRAASKEYDEPEDSVLDQLEKLYPESRIGRPFDTVELEEARRQGQMRTEQRIPPGFEDAGKAGDLRYGDYFLWRQILTMARDREVGVILVSRDSKPDWRQGKKEALPELVDEFVRETGSLFEMVFPQAFIRETSSRGFWTPADESGIDKATEEYERADAEDAQVVSANSRQQAVERIRKAFASFYDAKQPTIFDFNDTLVQQIGDMIVPLNYSALSKIAMQASAGLTEIQGDTDEELEGIDDDDDDGDEEDEDDDDGGVSVAR